MRFFVDFHIHSKYSRSTSPDLTLENLTFWGKKKGLLVLGTGDFTHPRWLDEIRSKLEEVHEGLYRLKPSFERAIFTENPYLQDYPPVYFLLTTEVSTTFKVGRTSHTIHCVLTAPNVEVAQRLNERLATYGDLSTNGRPSLHISARDLLELTLEMSSDVHLIPSHIWSPRFSLFSKISGFERIEDCFQDLTPHLFALEMGLSSNPYMSRRLSSLDRFTLLANSDAHSLSKLGRAANLFDTELSYFEIFEAIRWQDPQRLRATINLPSELGKYHFNGHKACKLPISPEESRALGDLCPICKQPLLTGVMQRVEDLADRRIEEIPPLAIPFQPILPLEEIVAELLNLKASTKKVQRHVHEILFRFGPELPFLLDFPLEEIDYEELPILPEALKRLREGHIIVSPGYAGAPGHARLFDENEPPFPQQFLFPVSSIRPIPRQLSLFDVLAGRNFSSQETPSKAPQLSLFHPFSRTRTAVFATFSSTSSSSLYSPSVSSSYGTIASSTAAYGTIASSTAVYGTIASSTAAQKGKEQSQRDVEGRAGEVRAAKKNEEGVRGSKPSSSLQTGQERTERAKFSKPSLEKIRGERSSFNVKNAEQAGNGGKKEWGQMNSAPQVVHSFLTPARLIGSLNVEQKIAVKHWEGPIYIFGLSGTGKTYTLLHRVAYLILSQTLHPFHFLVFTPSNRAAHQFSQKLDRLLGFHSGVTVGTFERFCLNLLLNQTQVRRIIGENERFALISHIAKHHGYQISQKRKRQILDEISRAKQNFMFPGEFDAQKGEVDPEVSFYFHEYEIWLKRTIFRDMDDLLLASVQLLLEDISLRKQLQARFRSIHIDEYQDLTKAQHHLLQLLVSSDSDLCVMSDPEQAIYGYRGGGQNSFQRFSQYFSRAERPAFRHAFWRNYRSPEKLVDAAQELIFPQVEPSRPVPFVFSTSQQGPILNIFDDDVAEAFYIAESIESLVGSSGYFSTQVSKDFVYDVFDGSTFAQIAIIYRDLDQLPTIKKALQHYHIPYKNVSLTSLVEKRGDLRFIIALLRYFTWSEGDFYAFLTLVSLWLNEEFDLYPYLDIENFSPVTFFDKLLKESFLTLTQRLQLERLKEFLHHLEKFSYQDSSQRFVETTLELLRHYALFHLMPKSDSLELLKERALISPTLEELQSDLLLDLDPDPFRQPTDRVSLVDMRALKGLQFYTIFIPACVEGILPNRQAFKNSTLLDEEYRLCYSAMMRSERNVYLSYARHYSFWKQKEPLQVSRFITPLCPFLEIHDYSSQKRKKSHQPCPSSQVVVHQSSLFEVFSPSSTKS